MHDENTRSTIKHPEADIESGRRQKVRPSCGWTQAPRGHGPHFNGETTSSCSWHGMLLKTIKHVLERKNYRLLVSSTQLGSRIH
jgi:hypothetical protein